MWLLFPFTFPYSLLLRFWLQLFTSLIYFSWTFVSLKFNPISSEKKRFGTKPEKLFSPVCFPNFHITYSFKNKRYFSMFKKPFITCFRMDLRCKYTRISFNVMHSYDYIWFSSFLISLEIFSLFFRTIHNWIAPEIIIVI